MNSQSTESQRAAEARRATDPPVSAEVLKEFADAGDGFFVEIRTAFIEDIDQRLKQIKDALETRDADAIARSAHDVKGTSANFGAWRLQSLGREIETLAKAGDLEGVVPLLAPLAEAIDDVKAALLAFPNG